MLKRLRPATPPALPNFEASQSSVSLNGGDPIERLVKRRRVQNHQDLVDDEDDGEVQNLTQGTQPTSKQEIQGEYSHANNLLHELHTLHHHRLMFSTPHTPHAQPGQVFANGPDGSKHSQLKLPAPIMPGEDSRLALPSTIEESELVTKNYEGTNRFLGSLVLSRRRHLNASDDNAV